MESKLSPLQHGEVCMFMALMKDGTALPVPKGILIGIDRECEEIYVAHLNMHPLESQEIFNGIIREFE